MAKRILMVDDEPRNLALLEGILQPQGYEIIKATDGSVALGLLESCSPDLVLVDYVMPGLDGIDVLTHVRASRTHAHTPVVLVTGHADREHRLHGMEAGADEFLEKPIDAAILLARTKTLLALKESRDALQVSRDELARRNAALEASQRERRDLMAFIVHDLKTPLAVIHLGIDWLISHASVDGPEVGEVLAESRQASLRLKSMIFDLLMISRLEQPALVLRCESIDVAPFVDTILRSYQRRADERGITLLFPAPNDLRIEVDRSLLERVFENILENALRFTPSRGRIDLKMRQAADVEIVVSNDGPPIPARDRHRIFEKFRRGEADGDRRGNAGLGLYFCKRAVEAHGGTIEVVELPEWPTSFVVRLPAPRSPPS